MAKNNFTNAQLKGAESLVNNGLQLKAKQPLLLIYQDEFTDAALCIEEIAKQFGIPVELRSFSKNMFYNGYPEAFSEHSISSNMPQPRGIILLIEWSEETTAARLALLKNLENKRHLWRIASMPGVNIKDLPSCISDFNLIKKFSKIVFAILSRSNQVLLETINHKNELDKLVIPINKYHPIISTGEIQEDRWGNFPSGETFIVPDQFCAEGWVTVRGSIPHYPLKRDEWIRMEISKGKIKPLSVKASSENLRKKFLSLFFTSKNRVKSSNSNSLAELGIGTNPGIIELTGMPIFDEKKIGTVHIAFGMNDQFGGPLKSKAHHDIVCTNANLTARNNQWHYEIIQNGEFIIEENIAFPNFSLAPSNSLLEDKKTKIVLGKVSYNCCESQNQIKLKVNYKSVRDDITFIVASGETALVACDILKRIESHKKLSLSKIFDLIKDVDADIVRKIISRLVEYRIIKLTR